MVRDHARETCPFCPDAKQYLYQNSEYPFQYVGTEKNKLVYFKHLCDDIKVWIEKNSSY